jgi:Holliday junction resolvasome RuvABC endonuclease subunit
MTLSAADKDRVAETVRQMVAEYRAKPTQEKEDALGVELARMPAEERDHVTTVLLQMLAEER